MESLDLLREDQDPIRRAQRAHRLMRVMQEQLGLLSSIRTDAVIEACRQGMTHSEAATALGLTRGRIAQMTMDRR